MKTLKNEAQNGVDVLLNDNTKSSQTYPFCHTFSIPPLSVYPFPIHPTFLIDFFLPTLPSCDKYLSKPVFCPRLYLLCLFTLEFLWLETAVLFHTMQSTRSLIVMKIS